MSSILSGIPVNVPVLSYNLSFVALTAGVPADVLTINIPFPRYKVVGFQGSLNSLCCGLTRRAGASVTGTYDLRDAAGGAGNDLSGNVAHPTSTTQIVGFGYINLVVTLQTLYFRQTAAASAADVLDLQIIVQPVA